MQWQLYHGHQWSKCLYWWRWLSSEEQSSVQQTQASMYKSSNFVHKRFVKRGPKDFKTGEGIWNANSCFWYQPTLTHLNKSWHSAATKNTLQSVAEDGIFHVVCGGGF